ncbi:MAG: alpha/beta hydrolase [Solirubrobacteraceae bacterium]
MLSQTEKDSHIALPDGRALSYVQAGADAGPMVTVLDGPCSRGLGLALAPTARELGIRLLIPDRPGIHGSAAKPGRTIADWPADQLALLDALDIDRTGVVTQSGGTGYGIAVAASAPRRLTGLALLGALAPMTSRDARMDAGKQLRTAVFLARKAPFVLKAGLRRNFKRLPDSVIAQLPAADRPFLDDPLIRDIHLRTMREFLGNPDAAIEEIRLLAKPWGITPPPPGAIPTALWTAEQDEAHPPPHARRVAELLGGDPPVTVVPGIGTFGLGRVFPDVLRFAIGR